MGRLRPALEQGGALAVAGGGERERFGQVLLRAFDVECERALAGEGEVADRAFLELLRLSFLAGGAGELERLQVVVGEHVGQVFCPLARLALDPGGGGAVAGGAGGAGDLRVADVSDQQVPEAVLGLPLHRAGARGADELLAGELVQGELDLARLARAHLGERAGPEDLAHHGGVLEQALALGGERVQAGGDQRLHRVGDLLDRPAQLTAVGEQTHELLRVERVAARPLEQRLLCLRRQDRALEERGEEAGRLLVRERGEVDRGRIAQAGRPGWVLLVELRAGVAEEEQGHPLRPVGQVLEEGEESRVRPVQVLEDEHRLPRLRPRLEEAAPGGEGLLL